MKSQNLLVCYVCNVCLLTPQVNPALVVNINFVKPKSTKSDAKNASANQKTVYHEQQLSADDLYQSLYRVIPSASIFTLVSPPSTSHAPTTINSLNIVDTPATVDLSSAVDPPVTVDPPTTVDAPVIVTVDPPTTVDLPATVDPPTIVTGSGKSLHLRTKSEFNFIAQDGSYTKDLSIHSVSTVQC